MSGIEADSEDTQVSAGPTLAPAAPTPLLVFCVGGDAAHATKLQGSVGDVAQVVHFPTVFGASRAMQQGIRPRAVIIDAAVVNGDGRLLRDDIGSNPLLSGVQVWAWGDVPAEGLNFARTDWVPIAVAITGLVATAAEQPPTLHDLVQRMTRLEQSQRRCWARVDEEATLRTGLAETVRVNEVDRLRADSEIRDALRSIKVAVETKGVVREVFDIVKAHPKLAGFLAFLVLLAYMTWGTLAGQLTASLGEWGSLDYRALGSGGPEDGRGNSEDVRPRALHREGLPVPTTPVEEVADPDSDHVRPATPSLLPSPAF